MSTPCEYPLPLPAAPIAFSILISSPIRCNLPFSPVSSMILPLARTDIYFGGLVVAALDVLMTFLFRRSFLSPPTPNRPVLDHYPVTLTLAQLTELLKATANGENPFQEKPVNGNPLGQGTGSIGTDEPLFPDNLSVSLIISAPFITLDGSPDTAFNVPLFELPGIPGNLVLVTSMLIAQFFVERSGIGSPGCEPGAKSFNTSGK